MKNGILWMVLIFTTFSVQGQDYQWVIKEGMGIDMSITNPDKYINQLSSSTGPIYFVNFKHPKNESTPPTQPRNDVFAIFNDGLCFNSFILEELDWPQPRMTTPDKGFILNDNTEISYLYWTNRYEGDDDNEKVTNNTPLPAPPAKDITISTGQTHPPLSVNHNVVANTEITIIIHPNDTCGNYFLKYNDCTKLDCPSLLTPDFNFFENTNVAINTAHPTNQNEIKLNFNSHGYAYVNFNTAESVTKWAVIDALAKFSLYGEPSNNPNCVGTIVSSYLEVPIQAAHDPNFMQLQAICEKNGEKILSYYVQVQNTAHDATTDNVKIEIPMPPCVNVNDIFIQKIYFNGNSVDISNYFSNNFKCQKNGNNLTFIFPPDYVLYNFNQDNPFKSVAAVEFCVKAKNCATDILKPITPLLPSSGTSHFDSDSYDIETFIDLKPERKDDGDLRPILGNNCNCDLSDAKKCPCKCPWYNLNCCKKQKFNPVTVQGTKIQYD